MDRFSFFFPSTLHYGRGAVSKGAEDLAAGSRRVILVVDSSLPVSPLVSSVKKQLEAASLSVLVFDDLGIASTAPVVDTIRALAEAAKAEGIVGLGGLRALSYAKAAARLVNTGLRVEDFIDGTLPATGGIGYIEIPTTGRSPFMLSDTVLLVDGRNRNGVIGKLPGSKPKYVFFDPSLAGTISKRVALSTALDTLLFTLEGYFSKESNFLSDTLLLRSLSASLKAIPGAGSQGKAAEELYDNSFQAGLFSALGLAITGPGPWSALIFSLNSLTGVPKSFCAVPFLPEILEYGRVYLPEKIARIIPILGITDREIKPEEGADLAVETIRTILGVHDLPTRLKDLGIKEEVFHRAIDSSFSSGVVFNLPKPLSKENLLDLLKQVF